MTLLELLQLLRKHLRLVIALPVVFALVAAVYCWGFMPNQYTAETSIYALSKTESAANGTEAGLSYGDLNASQLLANDFAELAKNEQVQAETALSLGMEDLSGYKVSITSSTTTRVIKLSVTGSDPNNAALIANKLASEIGKTATKVMDVKAVNVITKAKAPVDPSGPKRGMYTLVALLAGLFLAIALVVLMDMLNTTIRNDEDVTEGLGLPIIGRFPESKGGR
ncbi:MAG: Wzz/FepE/Etk N-terminal domain-containing protein [Eggerthellales bacterium]|nr:Wzz/FepE/Etk N-terminal domain-containing protein [Eggerthellales bacterium]